MLTHHEKAIKLANRIEQIASEQGTDLDGPLDERYISDIADRAVIDLGFDSYFDNPNAQQNNSNIYTIDS